MALRSEVIDLVAYDVGQDIDFYLTNRRTGLALDLTGVTVATGKLVNAGENSALETETLTIVAPVTDGHLNLVTPAGFLDHPAGRYEIEVSLTDGVYTKTVYRRVQLRLRDPA